MAEPRTVINAQVIDGTLYIVESVPSDTAKETASDKVRRLIEKDTESYQIKPD